MMNKVANIIFLVEVLVHILLVISSLVFSTAGYPINNILSPEGLRWSFLNAASINTKLVDVMQTGTKEKLENEIRK